MEVIKKSPSTISVFSYLLNQAIKGQHSANIPSHILKHLPILNDRNNSISEIDDIIRDIKKGNRTMMSGESDCIDYIAKETKTIFQPDIMDNNGLFTCYRVQNDFFKEENFRNLSKGETSHLKFHGSQNENWYSIIINGLKNYSNTRFMTTGAAYGPGVYLSSAYSVSCGYASKSRDSYSILGVYEVIGSEELYSKGGSIFVVPDDSQIILRYLIISQKMEASVEWLNKYFEGVSPSPSLSRQRISEMNNLPKPPPKKGVKRLFNEISKIQKANLTGIHVSIVNDDLTNWEIKMFDFTDSPIEADMKKLNVKEIVLQAIFAEDYPFHPPFIRIISPKFQSITGHVTSGGAICMELLTPNNWSQLISMENVLVQIKSLIISGGGRLVSNDTYGDLKDAKFSFQLVAKSHGWI